MKSTIISFLLLFKKTVIKTKTINDSYMQFAMNSKKRAHIQKKFTLHSNVYALRLLHIGSSTMKYLSMCSSASSRLSSGTSWIENLTRLVVPSASRSSPSTMRQTFAALSSLISPVAL